MIQLFIAAVVVLLVALILVFRLSDLVGVIKGKQDKPDSKSNTVNAVLMLVFLIVGGIWAWQSAYSSFDLYNLPVASEHGVETDKMFWWTMGITGVAFIITQILLFYFSFRYRYKKNVRASYYHDNSKLEILWTAVPAVVMTILVGYGLVTWNKIMDKAPEDSEVIEIMGMQFAWKVRYPGADGQLGTYDYRKIDDANLFGMDLADRNSHDDFAPRELHVPKGKPVLLNIRARDVLHSVYIPAFRVKMDAVPGMPTKFWFVPTKSTAEMRVETGNPDFNYELACTEVCGNAHFAMRMVVVVDEPEDYERWKEEQRTWLSLNPEYLSQVPEDLKEVAMISAGIEEEKEVNGASF